MLHATEAASEAYSRAFALLQIEQSPEIPWSLVHLALAPSRPVAIQFELFRQFVLKAPQDTRVTQVLEAIGMLSTQLFASESVPAERLQANTLKLAQMIECFPIEHRSHVLASLIPDDICAAHQVESWASLKPLSLAFAESMSKRDVLGGQNVQADYSGEHPICNISKTNNFLPKTLKISPNPESLLKIALCHCAAML